MAMMKSLFAVTMLAGAIGTAGVAHAAAPVTVGANTTANCYPFSCFASDGGSIYQQVYNSGVFSGQQSFNTIKFYNDNALGLSNTLNTASFEISFYYSPLNSTSLTATPAANRGALISDFGQFSVSGTLPSILSFTGNTINYDPLQGSLLMQVGVTGYTKDANAGYNSYFQADAGTATTARTYVNSDGPGEGNSGLVTTFATTAVAAPAPEPATWALMIVGFGAVGVTMRRRQKIATRVSYAA